MDKNLKYILSKLEDNKALDIVSIDLKGKSDIADFLVIATGTSNRHVGSMSEHLISELKKEGIKEIKAEGLLATCIQHEIDHLEGILFIDYLSKLKKSIIIKKLSKQKKENIDRIVV